MRFDSSVSFAWHRRERVFGSARPLLFCLLPFLLVAGRAPAAERAYPLPVNVDRGKAVSSMVARFTADPVNAGLPGYDPTDGSDLEQQLAFVDLLLAGDIASATQSTRMSPTESIESVQQALQAYAGLLAERGPETLILDNVHIGEDRVLMLQMGVVEQEGTVVPLVRSLRFVRAADGTLLFEGTARDDLSILLTDVYQVRAERGGLPSIDPESLEFEYTMPGTESGEPVSMHFNGEGYAFDVFNDSVPEREDGVLEFFAEANRVLVEGDPAEYPAFWTAFSEGRVTDWVQNYADRFQEYRDQLQSFGREVLFVLNADPLYLVFHTPTSEGVTGLPIEYTMLYRNESGDLQLTNFFLQDFFQQFISARSNFQEPFLRPFLRDEGLVDEARSRGRVTVAFEAEPQAGTSTPEEAMDDEDVDESAANSADVPTVPQERSYPWGWIVALLVVLALIVFLLRRKSVSSSKR